VTGPVPDDSKKPNFTIKQVVWIVLASPKKVI
jgi:hypothetical protein